MSPRRRPDHELSLDLGTGDRASSPAVPREARFARAEDGRLARDVEQPEGHAPQARVVDEVPAIGAACDAAPRAGMERDTSRREGITVPSAAFAELGSDFHAAPDTGAIDWRLRDTLTLTAPACPQPHSLVPSTSGVRRDWCVPAPGARNPGGWWATRTTQADARWIRGYGDDALWLSWIWVPTP